MRKRGRERGAEEKGEDDNTGWGAKLHTSKKRSRQSLKPFAHFNQSLNVPVFLRNNKLNLVSRKNKTNNNRNIKLGIEIGKMIYF